MRNTRKSGPERGASDIEIAKIIELRDRHGLTFDAISSRLGISSTTVSVIYRRARAAA